MKNEAILDGFLSVSEAVSVLARGMWGGLRRPHPVRQLKKQYRNVSVGFGLWKEQAGRCFRTAVIEGNVQVYVFAKTSRSASHIETEPVPLSIEVLERLIAPRGGLPDHAVRPSLKTAGGDTKLLALLVRGILLVSKKEFDGWYRSQRSKRRWASQRLTKRRSGGRPSLQTGALRSAVLSIMRENKVSIAELRRRLVAARQANVPSSDTLERLVDQLYRELGRAYRKTPIKVCEYSPSYAPVKLLIWLSLFYSVSCPILIEAIGGGPQERGRGHFHRRMKRQIAPIQ